MSGFVDISQETTPATPAVGVVTPFVEQTSSRIAAIDETGTKTYLMQRTARNFIMNAALMYWQRSTAATPATYMTVSNTTGRTYIADGVGVTNQNASASMKRVDTISAAESGLQARYYAQIRKDTNAGKVVLSLPLIGDKSFPLRGKFVRVRVLMRSISGSGFNTMRLGLLALSSSGTVDSIPATFVSAFGATSTDPTWGTNLSALTPTVVDTVATGGGTQSVVGTGVNCTLSGAWQRFSAVFQVPAGTKNLIMVIWSDGQGSINDEFAFAEPMLTEGQEVRDYIPADPMADLEECWQQYFKTFALDSPPVQNAGADSGEFQWTNTVTTTGTNRSPSFRYPVQMRATPTQTFFNPSAANATIRDETAGGDTGSNAVVGNAATGFRLTYTGNAGGAVGGLAGVHFTAEAGL
jgi:hypothetical protein